jgi:hypothetical protein
MSEELVDAALLITKSLLNIIMLFEHPLASTLVIKQLKPYYPLPMSMNLAHVHTIPIKKKAPFPALSSLTNTNNIAL